MSNYEIIRPKVDGWRVLIFFAVMTGVILFYFYRLYTMQIVEGASYLAYANENRTREISVVTQRGIIFDRNDFVLARNIASYNVVITPALLPGDPTETNGDIQKIYRDLSELIDVPVDNGDINDAESVRNFTPCYTDFGISQVVYIGDTNAPYNPVRIACNIDPQIAMIIKEKKSDWPGVDIEILPIRDYPTGVLTSEVIGFLGPIPASEVDIYEELGFVPDRDKVGYAGVEQSLDDELIGTNGKRIVEVDGAGQIIRDLEVPVEPMPGNNIKLTIDTRLQSAAKTALINNMTQKNRFFEEPKYFNGAVLAMNPKTGEILALVSQPTYENNRFARIIPFDYYNQLQLDPWKPLFNTAISAAHAPGSVFKMAAAIGALNESVIKPETVINDPGKITIMQKFTPNDPGTPRDYVCYTYKDTGAGHGDVNFLRGVALSCNVYFYKIGGGFGDEVTDGGLGPYRLAEYARALGYGSTSGIELPGEATGIVPDPKWKRLTQGENWATGDTYIATVGQGFVTATPLQVLIAFATLANDGIMMKPTLVKEVLDFEGNVIQPFTSEQIRDITKDPVIQVFDEFNVPTGEMKSVEPWVIQKAKEGMREVVTNGTATDIFAGFEIPSAGKTGTAEFCDALAQKRNICLPERWPAHAWYAGYAPYDDPEIVVVAFVYNGDEGAILAAPVVRDVMEAYFELKEVDVAADAP
jgi:penicillin-binding protein 2